VSEALKKHAYLSSTVIRITSIHSNLAKSHITNLHCGKCTRPLWLLATGEQASSARCKFADL